MVNKGEMYELYSDVERLLPEHIKPECVEKMVTIEEYVRKDLKKNSPKKGAQGTKRKRNDDIARNIPDGASTGFVSVRDLITKGSKKKPKKVSLGKDFEAAGEDDDTDLDIESGLVLGAPRRTQSAAADSSTTDKRVVKARLKKSSTIGATKPTKSRVKKTKTNPLTSSQFSKAGEDDSDDLDIESGLILPPTTATLRALKERSQTQSRVVMSPTPEHFPPKKLKKHIEDSLLDLSDSEKSCRSPMRIGVNPQSRASTPMKGEPSVLELSDSDSGHVSLVRKSPQLDEKLDEIGDQDMSWLVDDDEEDHRDIEIVDSSPLIPKLGMNVDDASIPIKALNWNEDIVATSDPMEAMDDDSLEFVEPNAKTHTQTGKDTGTYKNTATAVRSLWSPSERTKTNYAPPTSRISPQVNLSSSPLYPAREIAKSAMPPPALPRRLLVSPGDSNRIPEPSFPVRPLGNHSKRRRIVFDDSQSPSMDMPPPSQRRLHRMESTPVRTKSKRKDKVKRVKPSLLDRDVNPLFDGEAAHSGDEVSEGYSEDEDESESDRMFIKDSPATQASQSYDQSLIYRQSLLTQTSTGPAFSTSPIRPRPFGRIDRSAHAFLPSSSPPPPDDELDQYHMGSFVVADDADISYED